MRAAVTVGLLGLLIVYLVIGGVIFWSLESDHEQELKQTQTAPAVNQLLSRLIDVLNDVSDNGNCSSGHGSDDALCHLAENIQIAIDRFNGTTRNDTKGKAALWDIPGSIFFAMTVVTTIGYGNLAPKTLGGQTFCCFYAVLGIPLCLVVLVSIGDKLRSLASRLDAVFTVEHRPRLSRLLGKHVRSAIILAIGAVFFLFIPSAIFSSLQGWSYGTAVYYGIVSLSTTGFGDYVAGMDYVGAHGALYRLSVAVWIFLGLSWLSGLINSVQESLQTIVKDVNDRPLIRRINSQEKVKEDPDNQVMQCHVVTDEEDAAGKASPTEESQL